jgi:hypothetical protein
MAMAKSIEQRIQELEDRDEIKELTARYGVQRNVTLTPFPCGKGNQIRNPIPSLPPEPESEMASSTFRASLVLNTGCRGHPLPKEV